MNIGGWSGVRSASLALLATFSFCSVAFAGTASIDGSGRILKNGVPWFPLGLYHVSWIGDRMGSEAVNDLHLAADAGFDLMHPTVDAREDMVELLDAASARGIEIIAETPWPEHGPNDFVNKWKSHPAIIGWNIQDDFNAPVLGPPSHPPAEVAARRDVIDMLDPQRLTYASGTQFPGSGVGIYAGTMELMGFQSYPISEESYPYEYELEEAMDGFDYVRSQLEGTGQAWVPNVQAYRWKTSLGRYPTLRESRNMLYAPLIRGAKGVFWYTMWEGNGTLLPSAAPALWAELPSQVAEMKSLIPFFLEGTLSVVPTGLERVHAGLWELENQIVVAVLNTHRTTTFPVSLALPTAEIERLSRMFPGRSEDGMTVDGGNLVGSIGPEEVHVYLLERAVAGNASPTAAIAADPAEVAYGETRDFDASASTDSDGSIVSYEWDFGDGSFATGAQASHAYAKPGSYWTRLTVRDEDGATATAFEETVVSLTSLCPAAPRSGCTSATSSIRMSMPSSPSKRSLQWRWENGSVASFGAPATTTEIALCLYGNDSRLLAAATRPATSLWSDRGSAGLRFKDRDARPGGLFSMQLRAGSASARIRLKAKGPALGAVSVPLAAPVTVQLAGSDRSECEEAVFESGDISLNTQGRFAASLP